MKKRVMSLLLVMLMVFALLPAAAMATNTPAPKDENNVYLAKSYDPESGKITLEAYTKGEVTVTSTEKAVPCDIVLVLDVSGSMNWGFGTSLTKTAAELYASAGNKDGLTQYAYRSYGSDYPIYIYKYGSEYYVYGENDYGDLEEIDSGVSGSKTFTVYQSRLSALKTAVNLFVDEVQKNAAENNVNHRVGIVSFASSSSTVSSLTQVKTVAEADALKGKVTAITAEGATQADKGMERAKTLFDAVANQQGASDRAKAVVMFTDGEPTSGSTFEKSVANAAVKASKTLKGDSYKAQVYTVGVFNNPGDNVKKYMNAVSSNYPNANEYNEKGVGTEISGYFMNASSATELNGIFTKIADQTISGGSLTELDAQSYLIDKMSDYFQLDGVAEDLSKVEIFTEDYTAENHFTNRQPKTGLTVSVVDGDTVKVTGYDFSENWVGYDASTKEYRGQKLIIKFPVQPKAGYTGTVPTNKDISGLYDKDDKVALTFPMPDYTPNHVSKIIDFNAKMVLAGNVGKLGDQTKHNGLFELSDGGELTYQFLPTETLGDRYANLAMSKVDSAMTFTSSVWTQYDAIPANNIYFDDSLLSEKVNVGDGSGLNLQIPASTDTNAVATNGERFAFTFTGTAVDVYCTTNTEGGVIQAALYEGNVIDQVQAFEKDNTQKPTAKPISNTAFSMRNYSETERLNVPTVHIAAPAGYGTYTVYIYAMKGSNYKLDGVRVYNTMPDQSVYAGSNEANAKFFNLRDYLINDGESVTVNKPEEVLPGSEAPAEQLLGVLFVDDPDSVTAKRTTASEFGTPVTDDNGNKEWTVVYGSAFAAYKANGPKNEIYLAGTAEGNEGQMITFKIDKDNVKADHYWLGLSAPDQGKNAGTVQINGKDYEIKSAVDMYYPITPYDDGTVVVQNTGSVLISVTNLKTTGDVAADVSAETYAHPFAVLSEESLNLMANRGIAPAAEETQPEADNSLQTIIRNLISSFVQQLFSSISRLFGN